MRNLARAVVTAVAAVSMAAAAAPIAAAATEEAPKAEAQQAETADTEQAQEATSTSADEKSTEAEPATESASKPKTAPEKVVIINFGDGDTQIVNEYGPGNLFANAVKNSKKVPVAAQNEAIRTGDIKSTVKGKNNTAPFEIEGSEQDQNEG